jgi:RND family efflux transporter MFP subunit
MSGQIEKFYVKEGMHVDAGETLVKISTNVLDKQLQELQTRYALAKDMYDKQKVLWDKQIGSEMQYKQAKNNKEALEKNIEALEAQKDLAVIKAPYAGIIDKIYMKEGELANPGMRLLQLVNLDELYIHANISENYLAKIKKGDKVEVSFPVYKNLILHVPIYRTGNIIDPTNRTFEVTLKIKNPQNKIKPNMITDLHFIEYQNDSAMVLPANIVKTDNVTNQSFVFLITKKKDGLYAKKEYVNIIQSYNDLVEVTKIKTGAKVILEGDVTNGSKVFIDNSLSMYHN